MLAKKKEGKNTTTLVAREKPRQKRTLSPYFFLGGEGSLEMLFMTSSSPFSFSFQCAPRVLSSTRPPPSPPAAGVNHMKREIPSSTTSSSAAEEGGRRGESLLFPVGLSFSLFFLTLFSPFLRPSLHSPFPPSLIHSSPKGRKKPLIALKTFFLPLKNRKGIAWLAASLLPLSVDSFIGRKAALFPPSPHPHLQQFPRAFPASLLSLTHSTTISHCWISSGGGIMTLHARREPNYGLA